VKAIRIHSYGNSEQLKVEDAPQPQPGPGEVVVRVRSAGVNPVDWKIREGAMRAMRPSTFPLTLGQDIAGEVAAAAEGENSFRVGERVFGFASGAYAEYASAEAKNLARIPDVMTFEAAAALPTPGVTAYQVVTQAAEIQSGQYVLVQGAAGSVGSIVVQIALLRKAEVAATAVNDDDTAYLRELGVELAINSRTERFEDRLAGLAGLPEDRGVDAVIDLVGGETQKRSLAVLRPGGVLVTTVGGLDEELCRQRAIRPMQFVMARSGADLAELAKMVERGDIRLRLARVLPLEQAKQAQDLSQQGDTHGKITLKVA